MSDEFRAADVANAIANDVGAIGGEWPDPRPLPKLTPDVMEFDPALLPESLRGWIEDIADRTQCPIDFPAIGAMVALAAVIGRRVCIRPKQHDDWLVVPNLWGAIIGRPGIMKSPPLSEVLKPLKRLEVVAKEEHQRSMANHEVTRRIAIAQKKMLDKNLVRAMEKGEDPHKVIRDWGAADDEPPSRVRYMTNDSTVEKLGVILNENPNGVLCYRDELIGLLKSLDRDGQEGARAFYLEAWNGCGRFTYDRIGRGTLDIDACCVSVIGGIQPGPLAKYLRAAMNGGAGDDGLIQRFQLAVWPTIASKWKNVDRCPDSTVRKRAYAAFENLSSLDADALGAKRDEYAGEDVPFLRFCTEAQEAFNNWRARLEDRLRSDELHPALEAHLAKYRSLVPTLALLIHVADGAMGQVSFDAFNRAIGWATYLESHAERIYGETTRADVVSAMKLGAKLLSRALEDGFRLRDVYRHGWSGLATREEAAHAIAILLDHDWLWSERDTGTGGAPSLRHFVNPKIHGGALNGAAKTDTSEASL